MESQSRKLVVTESDFNTTVLQSTKPAVVEFGAVWCGTCHMLSPILDDLSREFLEKISICRVDVDDSPTLKEKYGIIELPTLLFFRDGNVVGHQIGAIPRTQLKMRLTDLVLKKK